MQAQLNLLKFEHTFLSIIADVLDVSDDEIVGSYYYVCGEGYTHFGRKPSYQINGWVEKI